MFACQFVYNIRKLQHAFLVLSVFDALHPRLIAIVVIFTLLFVDAPQSFLQETSDSYDPSEFDAWD